LPFAGFLPPVFSAFSAGGFAFFERLPDDGFACFGLAESSGSLRLVVDLDLRRAKAHVRRWWMAD